jgi:flagellin-like hook-associated protein FlgL
MRVSTLSNFSRVLLGLRTNQAALLRAQREVASGRRINQPSDDPAGAARALELRRALAGTERIGEAVALGRTRVDQAAATLQNSSELLTRARELLLQSMSGALNDDDRRTIAAEIEALRAQLLDDANLAVDGNYLFAGTAVGAQPWVEVETNGTTFVVYRGNGETQTVQAGADSTVGITAPGNRIYGRAEPGPTRFAGLTGAAAGTTADEGVGQGYLVFRHDGLDTGLLGSVGVAPIDGDDRNTLLGPNALVIDAAAGTVRLGSGTPVAIPAAGVRGDVLVRNELGGELHLDFEGWNGQDYSGSVTGRGSVTFDGLAYAPLDFSEADLELHNEAMGQVLHLDARDVRRAGTELVTFGSTANPFDVLQGIVDDLRNEQGLDPGELSARLGGRLSALDEAHDELLVGLGVFGARSARLVNAGTRQVDLGLQLKSRLSQVEDADLAEAALDLSRSQLLLELAQASGARLIQTTLLNFLG